MFVWARDIRYANILSAPPSPPGVPGLVCPFHNRIHEWRRVDLEYAQETNLKPVIPAFWVESRLRKILDHLPEGYYIDPTFV